MFFCTFSYHTSKGDCDPDSEHDYCSLHVRLRAGQVTAPSFFKLLLKQFFWWEVFWVTNIHWIYFGGKFFEWQTFIGSIFGWKFFEWQTFIGSIFWWDVFLVTLLEYFLSTFSSFIELDWLFVRNASPCLWPTMMSNFVHVITCCWFPWKFSLFCQ